jgi:acyl-CoA oxidase
VGSALDARRAEGMAESAAWNACARLLYVTASTHVRWFLLSKFHAVAAAVDDAPCRTAMLRLVSLFGLSDILQGEQWLGLLTADEAVFAEEAVHRLSEALRPDVIALTDAFDFPDRILNSTLGRADGNGATTDEHTSACT